MIKKTLKELTKLKRPLIFLKQTNKKKIFFKSGVLQKNIIHCLFHCNPLCKGIMITKLDRCREIKNMEKQEMDRDITGQNNVKLRVHGN